jgi:hypothetical protein
MLTSISSVTEAGTFPFYIKIKEQELKECISTLNRLNMDGAEKTVGVVKVKSKVILCAIP